jgi:hypothetical protein
MLCESWLQEQGLSLGPTLQMASNKGDPRRGGLGDGGGRYSLESKRDSLHLQPAWKLK